MSLCTHLQTGSPSFTMAQAASPRMDHSNVPDWSRYLQCLRPTIVFPVFARTVFTQPSSQLLFLHKSNHRRLLSLVSGTLHNQYCPTQYSFCLPRAPHVPWLRSNAGTCSPATTHTQTYTAVPPRGFAWVPSSYIPLLSPPAADQSPWPISSQHYTCRQHLVTLVLPVPHLIF